MKLVDEQALVERLAMELYCDTYTPYGTCTPERWRATSETQREFCRAQARLALTFLERELIQRKWTPPII